jgi:hypothetical protein
MLHTLAEFAARCKVSKPAVTQAVKRGQLVKADGKIDDANPHNALYLAGKVALVKDPAARSGVKAGVERVAPRVTEKKPAPKRAPKKKTTRVDDAEALEQAEFQREVQRRQVRAAAKAAAREASGAVGGDPDEDPTDGASDEDIDAAIAMLGKTIAGMNARKIKADIMLKEAGERKLHLDTETRKRLLIPREEVRRMVNRLSGSIDSNILKVPRKVAASLHSMAVSGSTPRELELELERQLGEALRRAVDEAAALAS